MTDFIQLLTDMRNGAVLDDCREKLTKVVQAVRDTGKKGRMTLSIEISPSKIDMNEVKEVEVTHTCVLIEPKQDFGKTTFYPMPDGALTRNDPQQLRMFEERKGEANRA